MNPLLIFLETMFKSFGRFLLFIFGMVIILHEIGKLL
jgi:hypothetical protein